MAGTSEETQRDKGHFLHLSSKPSRYNRKTGKKCKSGIHNNPSPMEKLREERKGSMKTMEA